MNIKSFGKRIIEISVLAAFLGVVTSPITKQLWAQAAPIRGEVSAGVYENLKSDGSGHLLIGVTNTSGVAVTSLDTQSAVALTLSGVKLTNSSTTNKSIFFYNNDTVYDACIGQISPVSCTTNSINLSPRTGITQTNNAPSNAWYGVGISSVQKTLYIKVGQ